MSKSSLAALRCRQNTMVPQSQIGFIDFIVSPTLGVAGEAVALILANKRDLEERPWTDILATNKAKWQAKVRIPHQRWVDINNLKKRYSKICHFKNSCFLGN